MANIKIRGFLFPKSYSNGEFPIYIRITKERKTNFISLGYTIPKEAWNHDKSEVWENKPAITKKEKESLSSEKLKELRKNYNTIKVLPNASKINSDIRKKIAEIASIQNKLEANEESITSEILKIKSERKDLREQAKEDFIQYIEKAINRKYLNRQIRTSEKYTVLKKKLQAFQKDKPLPISKITTSYLKDFQLYLVNEGSHNNYVHVNLKVLKTIISKEAITEDKILSPEKNPFLGFNMPKVISSSKERLSIAEIEKIEKWKYKESDFLFHVKNAFLFSLYNAGIRIGDLMLLKWVNIQEGRLNYFMGKTGKIRTIKLLPLSLNILKQYKKVNENDFIFPFLDNSSEYAKLITPEDYQKASPELLSFMFKKIDSRIAKYNAGLKEIAVNNSIKKKLSSHIARHSFSDIARKKGISVYDISKMLAHSNTKVTENYLNSLDIDSMDKAHEEVFK